MNIDERIRALRDLIELREPIPVAISRLRLFPWDSDATLVILTSTDLIRVLDRYLRGELSNTEVEEWAEALEGRDDIGYEPKLGDTLRQIIFDLANPLLATAIRPTQAHRWKEALSRSG
jgi:hypothetical protein